jgi:hypothetical protein
MANLGDFERNGGSCQWSYGCIQIGLLAMAWGASWSNELSVAVSGKRIGFAVLVAQVVGKCWRLAITQIAQMFNKGA